MTPDERDRLAKLEAYQGEMRNDIKDIKHNVEQLRMAHAKIGGIMFTLTMIGAFVGWVISQVKGFWGG